jgi:hypothetical protein
MPLLIMNKIKIKYFVVHVDGVSLCLLLPLTGLLRNYINQISLTQIKLFHVAIPVKLLVQ